MSDKPKFLVLWGEAPEYEYQENFTDKEEAINKIKEIKKWKKDFKSEHWAELFQYIGGFK